MLERSRLALRLAPDARATRDVRTIVTAPMKRPASASADPPVTLAAPPRKGGYARGDAARQRILAVAWEAFAEKGFRATSFNEIARAAGLTMPGLIHHFPSKVDLFAAVLEARDADDHARLLGALGEQPSVFEVLDAFVATARMNVDRASMVQLSHLIAAESARGDHPGTESVRAHFRNARGMVEQAVKRGIEAGEIPSDVRPEVVALQVVAMIEGLENQWLHEPDTIDLPGVFEAWIRDLKTELGNS